MHRYAGEAGEGERGAVVDDRPAMSGRHEQGHGAMAAAAAGGGGGTRAADGGGDAHEDDLVMPGFRFHPTEEELIEFYLRRKVEGKRFNVELITFLDLYRYDPWELPGLSRSDAIC